MSIFHIIQIFVFKKCFLLMLLCTFKNSPIMFPKVIFSSIYNFSIIFLKAMMFIMIAYKKQTKEYKTRVNLFF